MTYNKSLKEDDDLKLQLVKLVREDGLSIAQAARALGLSERTCQCFFKQDMQWAEDWWDSFEDYYNSPSNVVDTSAHEDSVLIDNERASPTDKKEPSVKILFIDIETAPLAGAVWGLWQNNVSLNQIERDWYILSFSAKWAHSNEVIYLDKSESWDTEDDLPLLIEAWKLLNQADIVVGQNSKRFDEKKLNARFIINGLQPPSHYRSVDTLEIAKKNFGFTSNKLEYLSDKLCKKYKKLKHAKFAGYDLWKECLKGNQEAWLEMQEYNVYDVLALEELYEILRPWHRQHPNINLYSNSTENICSCGHSDWEHDGYHYTNLSKFDRFRCIKCGAQARGRVNLLPENKRKSLRMNII